MAPKAKREHGTGSVYQRISDGMWIASVTLPSSLTGKRRRKTVARADEAAAWSELRTMRRTLLAEGDIATETPTLAQWAQRHFTNCERDGSLRARTLESHKGVTNRYITPTIGKIKLDAITPEHIRRVHRYVIEEKGLSPTTALHAHNVLSGILKAAVYDGLIRDNPATRTKRPRGAHYNAKVLTAEQAVRLLDWANNDPWHATRWSLALLAGLRQSEALGLTAADVDLTTGTIQIRRQLQRFKDAVPHAATGAERVSGQYWLVPPKSAKGKRQIPMVRPLAVAMEARLAAMATSGERFIVAGPSGGHVDHSKDRKRWIAALQAAGLPTIRLHDARHTTGTLLRAAGVEPRVIQVILGHNTAAMTEHYSHLGDMETVAAVQKFGHLLAASRKQIGQAETEG